MHGDALLLIARLVVYLIILMMPLLAITFTDRFRQRMSPDQYVTLFLMASLAGVLLFIPAISIVAATGLLAISVARLYAKYLLAGVTYSRTLTPMRLFPGDHAELALHLENRKILPLSWVTFIEPVFGGLMGPEDIFEDLLSFSGGLELLETAGRGIVGRTALGPFGALTRTYEVTGRRRGHYLIGPARIQTSDPFGIFHREAELGGTMPIIVYPRVYRPDEIGLPFLEAMGEMRTRRSLFEDPTLLAGSREYAPGDPLHRMHWKATARTGELQVRVSDPSTTAQLMIVLNLNTYQHLWQGIDLSRMEVAIDTAASIAIWALEKDFAVGMRSNGIVPGSEATPRIAPGAHPRQATTILEHLAQVTYSGRYTAESVLYDEARRLATGSSIIFVTSILTPPVIALLGERRLRGRVSVVYCGRHAAPVIRGVPVFLVSPPSEPERAVS